MIDDIADVGGSPGHPDVDATAGITPLRAARSALG